MTTKPNAAAFLANMNLDKAEEVGAEQKPAASRAKRAANDVPPSSKSTAATRRADLKHIGGYFDSDTVEKVALLRARLKLDNSELIKLAIDELYTKQKAARAFGN